jgi:hypothetical protein
MCCNLFLGPRTKKKRRKKIIINQKYSQKKSEKNNNSENRMSECPENGQNLIEEVQKYKD